MKMPRLDHSRRELGMVHPKLLKMIAFGSVTCLRRMLATGYRRSQGSSLAHCQRPGPILGLSFPNKRRAADFNQAPRVSPPDFLPSSFKYSNARPAHPRHEARVHRQSQLWRPQRGRDDPGPDARARRRQGPAQAQGRPRGLPPYLAASTRSRCCPASRRCICSAR